MISYAWGVVCQKRYQGQGYVITSHIIYGMQLRVPALDTCIWHNTSHMHYTYTQQICYQQSFD